MAHPHGTIGDRGDDSFEDSFDNPQSFDTGDAMDDDAYEDGAFEGDESFDEADAAYETEGADEGDGFEAADGDLLGDDYAIDGLDDLDDATAMAPTQTGDAAWSAFEAELADALDADGTDEFFGSLLGGFSRVASGVARHLGPAAGMAGRLAGYARSAGRHAGHASRLADAGSMLAQRLGHPALAQQMQRYGHMARGAGRIAGGVGGALGGASSLPGHLQTASQVAGRAAAHQNPLSELLAQIGQLSADGADDFEAFDAMADLYEDGVDAALPAAVGLAARLAARALGGHNLAQLSPNARRGFVRGIAAAARHLIQGAGPSAVRALPRLAASSARQARSRRTPAQQIPQQVGRSVTRAARAVARRPRAAQQLSQPISDGRATRPAGIGRGVPSITRGSARRYVLHGPVELTIRPL